MSLKVVYVSFATVILPEMVMLLAMITLMVFLLIDVAPTVRSPLVSSIDEVPLRLLMSPLIAVISSSMSFFISDFLPLPDTLLPLAPPLQVLAKVRGLSSQKLLVLLK